MKKTKQVLGAILALGISTAAANALTVPTVNVASDDLFQITEVQSPSLLAHDDKDGDHKCGEGKCGKDHKCGKDKDKK
jgi:uncharacterized low-complexity protein